MNIHENRGNAIRLLARVIDDAARKGLLRSLASLNGGSKSNAIPREAEAQIGVDEQSMAQWQEHLAHWRRQFAQELAGIDEGIELQLVADQPHTALDDASQRRLLGLVLALPHGVLAMSQTIDDLVESSSNVASVTCSDELAHIVTSSRSSLGPALRGVTTMIRAAAELAGAKSTLDDSYPGWQPNPQSPVTAKLKGVFETLWKESPRILAVHAGLECGLLGERIGDLDMVSFGPTIQGAHSPDECVHIEAVEKFWKTLAAALETLSATE